MTTCSIGMSSLEPRRANTIRVIIRVGQQRRSARTSVVHCGTAKLDRAATNVIASSIVATSAASSRSSRPVTDVS
jgi:hypothetical protein